MIDFNQAAKLLAINSDREEFYKFVKQSDRRGGKLTCRPLSEWRRLYREFKSGRKT